MDLENYWQQNKKTVISIGCGLLVFLIANTIVDGTFGKDLRSARRDRSDKQRDLRKPRYDADALDAAATDNEALIAARDALVSAVVFQPRPEFVASQDAGSISAQYFTRVEQVREALTRRASRAGLRPPDDAWGIEMPQTNAAPTVERHLEALDLIDRVVRLALDSGVGRISRIQVRLDPGFGSKQGLSRIERTRVQFGFDTSAVSMSALLAATQAKERYGQALPIEDFQIKGQRNRPGHVKSDMTFTIVRISERAEQEEDR